MSSLINCESKNELLLKIFSFLDTTSLKNLTLVNKRWYNIVINDISTMKKLPLFICGDILKHQPIVGHWKFYKVVFKSVETSFHTDILSRLMTVGAYIREIKFIDCYVSKPKEIRKILRNFPKAEKLTFKKCFLRSSLPKSDNYVLELRNLNEVVLDQCNLEVLSCIGAQLKSLKVDLLWMNNSECLMEFLHTQKRLETLALRNISNSSAIFAKKENAEFQFKLKKLSLRMISFPKRFDEENLKDFLLTQKDSVEILELERTFSSDIYELILNKFENVKTLRIDISDFPHDFNFYKIIKINKNVTKLTIYGVLYVNVVDYSPILSLFPNVTNISFLTKVSCKVLNWLSKYCNALTSLSLYELCPGKYQKVKFSSLKNLHLERVGEESEWIDLLFSNQTIESLSFRKVLSENVSYSEEFVGQKLIIACEIFPNLKYLKLGKISKANMSCIKNIVELCENLKSIDVIGEKIEEEMIPIRNGSKLCCHDLSSEKYIFPNHELIWKDNIMDDD